MIVQIEPRALADRLAAALPPCLLDVREPEEHALASLPGARLVPLGDLLQRLDDLEDWRDREMVVYCHHGIRSQHAIARLQAAGFTRLANLRGGIDRWSLEVDPRVPRY